MEAWFKEMSLTACNGRYAQWQIMVYDTLIQDNGVALRRERANSQRKKKRFNLILMELGDEIYSTVEHAEVLKECGKPIENAYKSLYFQPDLMHLKIQRQSDSQTKVTPPSSQLLKKTVIEQVEGLMACRENFGSHCKVLQATLTNPTNNTSELPQTIETRNGGYYTKDKNGQSDWTVWNSEGVNAMYRNLQVVPHKLAPQLNQTSRNTNSSRTSNVNAVCATCGKCVFNANHDACVSKFLKVVNARTKKPNGVPISTGKPKSQANKSVATPHKKTVASESTITNSKSYYRILYSLYLFIVDSGCTKHMTGKSISAVQFVENTGVPSFWHDQFAPILGWRFGVKGNIHDQMGFTYVEGLNHNLFSDLMCAKKMYETSVANDMQAHFPMTKGRQIIDNPDPHPEIQKCFSFCRYQSSITKEL
ncbi:hypothetical protein Tco_0842517 [Tanacetum coccineum]|uniref:Uncharacterized protein n=1 Tax=Tanacetum coccineum TaxID=301880 RepID=A0ABQ5AZH9_9ASTR